MKILSKIIRRISKPNINVNPKQKPSTFSIIKKGGCCGKRK